MIWLDQACGREIWPQVGKTEASTGLADVVLVDTSVWVAIFRKPSTLKLNEVVEFDRSGVDCLIAACAMRNGICVLHRDRDFDKLARISPLENRRV